MKITTYMYAKQECRITERGRSKVLPHERGQASASRLKATTGVPTAILRKGRLFKHTQNCKQVEVGISTAKGGETTEASLI